MPERRPRTGGYALPIALGVIAVMSIIVLTGARQLQIAQDAAFALQQDLLLEEAMEEAEAHTLYYLTTRSYTLDGVVLTRAGSETMADNTAAAADGALWAWGDAPRRLERPGLVVDARIRPANGLLSVSSGEGTLIEALLVGFSIERTEARRLAASLGDYQDRDDLARPGGAEVRDYAQLGLPPPRNERLVNLGELSGVANWTDIDRLIESGFLDTVTALPLGPEPAPGFMPPLLRAALAEGLLDPGYRQRLLNPPATQPSVPGVAFRIDITGASREAGVGLRRVLDIFLSPTSETRLYSRALVYERALTPEEIRETLTNDRAEPLVLRTDAAL